MPRAVILLVCCLIAMTLTAALAPPTRAGVEWPVYADASDQHTPAVWGNRVVWQDYRDGIVNGADFSILNSNSSKSGDT